MIAPTPTLRRARALGAAVALAVLLLACLASVGRAANGPLWTAVVDPAAYYGPPSKLQVAFAHTRAAGATFVRIYVNWAATDPGGRPADGGNPNDPAYDWRQLDVQVVAARQARLQPILSVNFAPAWAERGRNGPPSQYPAEQPGTVDPDPNAYGAFAKAIATRYSGHFGGLPRVRYFQAWNEPNIFSFLNPQFSGAQATSSTPDSATLPPGAQPLSPGIYRTLLNAFGHAVHHVRHDNLVIAGGLSPFGRPFARTPEVAPLVFMRDLLCLKPNNKPRRGCPKLDFDIWAMQPYTDGSPEHRAAVPGDVSIPELPQMHNVLMAAARARRISSGARVGFWVTEFSWNDNPPSPGGVPEGLLARWIPEALYRMWQAGVSLVTWYLIRDDLAHEQPQPASRWRSGLYAPCGDNLSCDSPRLIFTAFRFPFVAYRSRRGVLVWGRTPWGKRAAVIVEQLRGSRWHRLRTLRTNGVGIFTATLRTRGGGDLRARLRGGTTSVPFSLHRPPDITVNPFG
jgi:hypothetical protein